MKLQEVYKKNKGLVSEPLKQGSVSELAKRNQVKLGSWVPWWRGLMVSSPPATEETGAMVLEIESRQGLGW
jgi:hypothetical protein